jgi:hypothetical protein
VHLPGSHRQITTSGRVVRVEERESGRYETAIRLVDVPAEDRILLSRYVQRNRLRSEGEGSTARADEGGVA